MRRYFWILLILIVSVWIGLKISRDPGYALFAYGHWTVEMPLWFTVVAMIVFLLLVYIIMRFIDGIDFSLYRWKNWLRWRRKYKSYSKTNRGLIELIEGHWKSAENYLLEGVQQSDAPLINYLAAAKAAHEQGAFDRRDAFLRKAHHLAPQAEVAIGLTQAQLQYDQGQLEQSLATLDHLRAVAPKHGFVLKLLEKVYTRLADWQGLIKLLPYLRKAKLINDDQMEKFEINMYQELLLNTANRQEGLTAIQNVWQTIPKKLQHKPQLIYTYAKILLPYPEKANELEVLLNKTLKKTWDKDLVKLYGLLTTSDPKKQLIHAENWEKHYGKQATLLLTLGRLCERCQLWGKAKSYFEDSLALEANPETYIEYGKLLEHLGETELAIENYRDGLVLIAGSKA